MVDNETPPATVWFVIGRDGKWDPSALYYSLSLDKFTLMSFQSFQGSKELTVHVKTPKEKKTFKVEDSSSIKDVSHFILLQRHHNFIIFQLNLLA